MLTQEIKNRLPKLYNQEHSRDPIVHVKFFCPWNQWTWYATEGEPEGNDFRFFGYVIGHEKEWGYFILSELESARGPGGLKIERDLYFKPRPKSEITELNG